MSSPAASTPRPGASGPDWWRPALATGDPATRPGWAGLAEQAIAAAVPPPGPLPLDSWPQAFAVPFRPFSVLARDRLAAGVRERVPGAQAEPGLVADAMTAGLGPRLARLAVRTLVRELDLARTGQRLAGDSGRERFAGFIRQQSTPEALAALFTRYPVLARLLGTACLHAVDAGLELMTRFTADRPAIIASLLGGTDPGPVVAVEPGLGDLHRHGRSVAAVTFANGDKVIYKPRDLAAYQLLRDVAGWLNQRVPGCGLRMARALARPGYGWLELIGHERLARPAATAAFYRREGVLLAALYALQATDIHCENIIACADQPVLIDAETLLQPALPTPDTISADPAASALAASVCRTALLPFSDVGTNGVVDRSGMGGAPGQDGAEPVLDWDPPATDHTRLIWRPATFPGAANQPLTDGQAASPAGHEPLVLEGFRLGYAAITADRDSFTRIIESGRDIEVRVIIRTSRDYAQLLDESTAPDLLHDARDRDAALDPRRGAPAGHRLWRELARHELSDLRAGDIPLLTTRPASRDVWTSAGQRLPGLLDRPGLSGALRVLAAMDEVDQRDQEWVISASLATGSPAGDHVSVRPMPVPLAAAAAERGRMLTAACGLADQIVARGMTGPAGAGAPDGRAAGRGAGRSRVNWIGLQMVEGARWMVLPMGASLTDGYLGVGLFLAQLTTLTGVSRYAAAARRAAHPVPRLLDALAARDDLLTAIGCGAGGLGGISYALARMAALLDDAELATWAEIAVRATAQAAGLTASPGWMAGQAGCLAAMTAVQAELGSAAAGELARTCADQLTALVQRTDGRCVPGDDRAPAGFAAGPAGIGWALTRFAATGQHPRYLRAGQHAVRRGGGPVAAQAEHYGWCRGAAGLLVAHSCLDGIGPAELDAAGKALASRPILHDLSLCHGELGITDALATVAAAARADGMAAQVRQRAGLILDAAGRHTRYCGTPGGVPTPGLLSGLAGIGYGLLRLGFGDQVPSVLLLEPAAGRACQISPPDRQESHA
ncbi:MAG TPA: type 2 lanthipeptide synthetase LanM [Streptosporangiaceae bacterium]